MDKNNYKEFIKTVAEIEELKPVSSPTIRLDPDAEDVVKHNGEWVEITAKSNPTLGFKFVKLKEQFKACELGCGDIVANQVIEKRIVTHPVKHWRVQCKNCKCFLSPDGKGFIKGGHAIQAACIKYFSKDK